MGILNKRASGILLHITCLPSEFGIGDMGKAAFDFADFLKKAGQQYWQILPVNPTGASKNFSPYACYSAFAGNPLLIGPVLLYEEDLITKERLAECADFTGLDYRQADYLQVDYKRVSAAKNKIFRYAYNNFRKNRNSLGAEFDSFCGENDAGWLEDFACFVAFKKYFKRHLNAASWSMWPRPIRDKSACDIRELKKIVYREVELQKFLQFMFFKQWKSLKRYANSNGISIFGDVPIYIDHESSDVWSHPSIFKLDSKKMPGFIAGVPPDYYSKTGQLWKNPVYDWEELKKTGFSWWIDRMKFNFNMFDLVRLDHFRGFIAYWEVPAKEKAANNGRWVCAFPEEFFNLLTAKTGRLPIVAENLGVITPDVDAVMEKFGFPGLRVLQFAFGRDFPDSVYLPHNYVKNTVACTGTHDNNTLRGWLENEARAFEIKNLMKYLGQYALPGQRSTAAAEARLKDAAAARGFEDIAAAAGLKDTATAITGFKNTVAMAAELNHEAAAAGFNDIAAAAAEPNNIAAAAEPGDTELKSNSELAGGFEDTISKVINLLMASAANLVIIPMQDILGLGEKARMNRPSTSRGNWKWHMNQSMLSENTAERLAEITRKFKRE